MAPNCAGKVWPQPKKKCYRRMAKQANLAVLPAMTSNLIKWLASTKSRSISPLKMRMLTAKWTSNARTKISLPSTKPSILTLACRGKSAPSKRLTALTSTWWTKRHHAKSKSLRSHKSVAGTASTTLLAWESSGRRIATRFNFVSSGKATLSRLGSLSQALSKIRPILWNVFSSKRSWDPTSNLEVRKESGEISTKSRNCKFSNSKSRRARW